MDLQALQANYRPMNLGSSVPKRANKKSWLTSFIPTATSIAGGALGTLVAPGVGTAAGGAAGGLLGKKLQDLITGEKSGVGSYLTEGAFGALGGLGKAAEAGSGAYKALRAGEGLASASKTLRYGSEGAAALKGFQGLSAADKVIEANAANAGGKSTGLLSKVSGKANKVADTAMLSQAKGLERGTAESAIRDVGKFRDLGYSNLQKMAEHAPIVTGRLEKPGVLTAAKDSLLRKGAPVNTSGFMGTVDNAIANNAEIAGANEKKLLNIFKKTADKYGFQGDAKAVGQTTAEKFNGAMRDLEKIGYTYSKNSPVRKTILEITQGMRQPLEQSLSKVALGDGEKSYIIQALKSKGVDNPKLTAAIQRATTASELSAIESPFVTAGKMAKEGSAAELRAGAKTFDQSSKKVTGMLNEAVGSVVGNPAKAGVAKGAGLLGRITGRGVETGAPATMGALAGETAKTMAKAQIPARFLTGQYSQTPQQDSFQTDLTAPDMLPQMTDTIGSDTTGDTTGGGTVSQIDTINQGLQQAAIQALSSGDTKGLENIVKVAGLFQSMQPKKDKVSAAQAKQVADAQTALSSLDYLDSQLGANGAAQGPAKGLLARIPVAGQYLNKEGAAYDATKIEIATSLARAITGSSRPGQQVINNYMHSLPKSTDSPAFAREKLKKLRAELTTKLGASADYPNSQDDITSVLSELAGATE